MLRRIAAIFATVISVLSISTANAEMTLVVKPGDLIIQKDQTGWTAVKILAVDPWPDGSAAAHCLTYESTITRPTLESLKNARVRVWHAPIDARSYSKGWELIGNQKPSKDELFGFITYLKLTDFPRYAQFTGQDTKEIVRKANEHYRSANSLGEQGKRTEAIAEYGKAIDIFPLFYEAVDNRAFTYMELGKVREALQDFEESLRVNPNGVAAFFSRGECLMKLGQLKAAESVFQEGQSRFPEKRALFSKFLDQVRKLRRDG